MFKGKSEWMKTSDWQRKLSEQKHIAGLGLAVFALIASAGMTFLNQPDVEDMKQAEAVTAVGNQSMVEPVKQNATVAESMMAETKLGTVRMIKPDIEDALADIARYKLPGAVKTKLLINGVPVAQFDSADQAQTLIKQYEQSYVTTNTVSVNFLELVSIVEDHWGLNALTAPSEPAAVLEMLKKGSKTTKTYAVKDGENLWGISQKLKLSIDELVAANPGLDVENLKVNQKLNLIVPKPMLTVSTVERVKLKESVPFAVQYKESKNLYKGQTKVLTKGKDGVRTIEALVTKANGSTVSKQILNEVIHQKASVQLVAKGIKTPPSTVATGKLAKPFSRGVFSSPFGRRWGRMHKGCDFNMPEGSSIMAADGGRVEKVGFEENGYGLYLMINHGNGLKTVYAHTSKILVKVGDKVAKGQKVALSGNTGRSYSPHLHFEVYKNGTPVNPMKYITL